MANVKFRQLINMSIGTPEPGHVNFCALHCLLSCIADKLNILDETVDLSAYDQWFSSMDAKSAKKYDWSLLFSNSVRLTGGQDEGEKQAAAADAPGDPEGTESAIKKETESEAAAGAENTAPTEEAAPQQEPREVKEEMKEEGGEIKEEDTTEPGMDITGPKDIPTTKSGTNEEPLDEELKLEEISIESEGPKISIYDIDLRLRKLEDAQKVNVFTDEMAKGLVIMKDQIELSISQILLLTYLSLSKNPNYQHLQDLYTLSKELRNIHKLNVNEEAQKLFDIQSVQSLEWRESELQLDTMLDPDALDGDIIEAADNQAAEQGNGLESHLCYSPEKMLSQLMDLKSDFCLIMNKVNEISARILKQESLQTISRIDDLQEQVRDLRLKTVNLQAQQDRMDLRISQNTATSETNKVMIDEIITDKVDKSELDILLADKVDYNQLQRKVSLDQMLETQCRLDKKFCEVFRQISENDKKMLMNVEHLKQTLGYAAIEGILNKFKEQITRQIHALQLLLQEYIDSTNDDCAAAGARVKVLQNLACLSCDTTCVMKSIEPKVPKFPNAHTSAAMNPLVTYELSSIRKSGTMGYHRKNEFPHAPHAWMNRQSGIFDGGKPCVPRHAGGPHTVSTARERVDKVMLNKK